MKMHAYCMHWFEETKEWIAASLLRLNDEAL